MMNELFLGSCVILAANLIAALSQLLLKLAARKIYSAWWRSYINPLVIIAYGMFVVTTVMNVIALRYVPLSFSAALGASGQIFVPLISFLFLKEHIDRRKFLGIIVIALGIIIFSL